jgi:peptidoglycan-N-acetylglucosamine deacetylase
MRIEKPNLASRQSKPLASLSLDLDNEWSYLKTHGDPSWSSFPSYLDKVVPRVLDFLERRRLHITVFVVGQDAALEKNAIALRSIALAGHEIGNHSFHHEPWLHLYSHQEIGDEIATAEEHIQRVTGALPRGFRGPGYSYSRETLEILKERGYEYDASTLPTFIGPLARAYYFMKSRLDRGDLRQRSSLFGNPSDGLRPNRPYRWHLSNGELLEIPVTTMPGLRLPIHASYVIYLGGFSRAIALAYFRFALWLCRLTGTQPSLLLHSLDFIGCEDNQSLAFFPGMSLSRERKTALLSDILAELAAHFEIVPMCEHAKGVSGTRMRELSPAASRSLSSTVEETRPAAAQRSTPADRRGRSPSPGHRNG